MLWLHLVQQHVSITDAEARFVLGVGALLLLGGGLRLVQEKRVHLPEPERTTVQSFLEQEAAERLKPLAAGKTVDVNRADATQLEQLPGVGPVMAARILEYRRRNGAFRSIAELEHVKGIGPKSLERLRPFVSVNPE